MTGGHGHVIPRPDGVRARCGGPAFCSVCAGELARVQAGNAPAGEGALDAPVTYTCTRIQLIEALGNLPLGENLHLEPRGRMADRLLGQMPEARGEAEIRADERERIATLAEERLATYDLTRPCGCGRTHPGTGRPCVALIRSGQSFAALIREQP